MKYSAAFPSVHEYDYVYMLPTCTIPIESSTLIIAISVRSRKIEKINLLSLKMRQKIPKHLSFDKLSERIIDITLNKRVHFVCRNCPPLARGGYPTYRLIIHGLLGIPTKDAHVEELILRISLKYTVRRRK